MKRVLNPILGTRPGIAVAASGVIALAVMPIAAVMLIALSGNDDGTLQHLVSTVLPQATRTTILLMAGVGIGTAATGVCSAWLVSSCR